MPWFSLVVPPPKLKITFANGQRAVNKSHVCARDRMHALPRKYNGEESGNRWLHQWGILLWETAREYFSEKIHRLDESLASKQAARKQNFRCNFRAIRARGRSSGKREKEEKAEERGWAERGEKIVRRGIESANVQSTGGRFAFTRFEAIQFR